MRKHHVAQALQRRQQARRGLTHAPQKDEALALIRRGNDLLSAGRADQALAVYERVLQSNPDDVRALQNRGAALRSLRKHADALDTYRRALKIKPHSADALNNLGNLLTDLQRFKEALLAYDQALAIDPRRASTLESRGLLLQKLRRYREAAKAYALLLRVAPEHDYALGSLFHARQYCCDWVEYGEMLSRLERDARDGKRAALPFAFLTSSNSPLAQLQCARTYFDHKCRVAHAPLWNGERYRHERIRIAYVSADLRDHALAYLLAEVLARHDRTRFETVAISLRPAENSPVGRRIAASFERFINVSGKSNREVAELMRALEIDIAVDLMGYTQDHRAAIFGYRPAPVHTAYLGYPGTTGSPFMDYIIADKTVIPTQQVHCYSEKIAWLPDSYQARDTTLPATQPAATRASFGLPDEGFVFCCFNSIHKVTPTVFDIWMRLLAAVPQSVLWLLEGNDTAKTNIANEAQQRGIGPERIVYAGKIALELYFARLPLADLFLDTLPYNAHTTAGDALWAGLPVLTCMGHTFAGRVAASVLQAVGLPELITTDLREYEARALKLANNPSLLRDIRAKLMENRAVCPLFDADRLRRHIESAYLTMAKQSQRGKAPESFAVMPVGSPRQAFNPPD